MLNKLCYIKDLLIENDIDILFLQETELKMSLDRDLLQITDYMLEISHATDTARTAAYIRSNVGYERIRESQDSNVLMLRLVDSFLIKQICGLYRPFKMAPNVSQLDYFKNQLKQITDFVDDSKKLMLLGDFNLDFNKAATQNYTNRRIYDELLEMTNAFDLDQFVKEVTWSRLYNGLVRESILDHVYVGDSTVI